MRNNEISFMQLVGACLFITALVSLAIFNKMGPISLSVAKANLEQAIAAQ